MYISKEFKSGIRETLRTTVIAIIPILVVQIQLGDINLMALFVAFSIGLLRGIEKMLYEAAPENTVSKMLSFKSIK